MSESEKLRAAEIHTAEVIGQIDWISTQLSFKSVAALHCAVTGDREFLDVAESRRAVQREVQDVKSLCSDNISEQKNLQIMTEVADSLSTVCNNVLGSKQADHDKASLECPTVKERWKRFLEARNRLLIEEQARQNEIRAKLPQARQDLEQLAIIGMAVNVILAIALMKFIGCRIVNRIKVLTLNSQLLAEGKPLSGEVKEGKDEISTLDKTFRLMAQQLKDAMEREAIQARTDLLSGLQNRRAFLETSEQFIALGQRTKQDFSLMICDIDHFKLINDRYGHGVGDEAIKAMAEAIKSVVRKSDFAAGWGGEEFILGLPNTDQAGAMMLAERLRATIENIRIEHETGAIQFTSSIGVACFDANHEGFEQCIQRADGALYRAKDQGRNRVKFAEEEGTLRMAKMVPPA